MKLLNVFFILLIINSFANADCLANKFSENKYISEINIAKLITKSKEQYKNALIKLNETCNFMKIDRCDKDVDNCIEAYNKNLKDFNFIIENGHKVYNEKMIKDSPYNYEEKRTPFLNCKKIEEMYLNKMYIVKDEITYYKNKCIQVYNIK